MSRSHIPTPFSWNTSQTFHSKTLCLTDIGVPTTSSVFFLEYWGFSHHLLGRSNPFYHLAIHISNFLTIATSASNLLARASKSLALEVSLAICDSKLASVYIWNNLHKIRFAEFVENSDSSDIHLHVTIIKKNTSLTKIAWQKPRRHTSKLLWSILFKNLIKNLIW